MGYEKGILTIIPAPQKKKDLAVELLWKTASSSSSASSGSSSCAATGEWYLWEKPSPLVDSVWAMMIVRTSGPMGLVLGGMQENPDVIPASKLPQCPFFCGDIRTTL